MTEELNKNFLNLNLYSYLLGDSLSLEFNFRFRIIFIFSDYLEFS